MNGETLELFTKLSDSTVKDDWQKALNSLFITLRKVFVFDNLAIYLIEKAGAIPEPVYARAVGRGRSKEAEASWGEEIANQVVATDKITVFAHPVLLHLIGLPSPICLGCRSAYQPEKVPSYLSVSVVRNILLNKSRWRPWRLCRQIIFLRAAP